MRLASGSGCAGALAFAQSVRALLRCAGLPGRGFRFSRLSFASACGGRIESCRFGHDVVHYVHVPFREVELSDALQIVPFHSEVAVELLVHLVSIPVEKMRVSEVASTRGHGAVLI